MSKTSLQTYPSLRCSLIWIIPTVLFNGGEVLGERETETEKVRACVCVRACVRACVCVYGRD